MKPKENLLQTINHQESEWVPCPFLDGSIRVIFHNLTEYPAEPGRDDWGVEWAVGEEESGAGLPRVHPLIDPGDAADYPLPEPTADELLAPARKKLAGIDRERCLVLADNGWGIFERAWLLVGMERLFAWMFEQPAAVHTLLKRITDVKVRISRLLLDELDVDGIRYGDDWGGETALMMGPTLWRRFIKPEQERLYQVCKKRGRLTFQHTDGHIEEIIPDLIEIGLDILNPLQPDCNNLGMIKEQYGRELTFHGVVSSRVLDRGSTDDIDREVRQRVEQLATGGGYIIAPGHGLSYPEANLESFRRAVIKYGSVPERWLSEHDTERGDVEV